MKKFILILAFATLASAIGMGGVSQSVVSQQQHHQSHARLGVGGYGHLGAVSSGHSSSSVASIGHHGGIHPLGGGYGSIGGVSSGHSSSSVSSIGHHGGIHPLGGYGGLSRGISSSSVSTIGHHGGIHPLGGLGHIGAVSRGVSSASVSTIGHHHGGIHHPLGGIGSIGGIGHGVSSTSSLSAVGHVGGIGHILPAKAVVSHATQAYSIPAGYYGGLLTYPQVISNTVATNTLKIPGHAVDAYRGYYGGYYPGSVGYGASYRFFH